MEEPPKVALAALLPDIDDPPLFLSRHASIVRDALRASAPLPSSHIGRMAAYHMGWEDARGSVREGGCGKLLRASLTLWAAGAFGDPGGALDAAVAVEWIHNFTLVHDDIQDGDRQRRHRPTLWTVVGEAQAIIAGDALHAVAQRLLTRPGAHPARRLRAAHALSSAVVEVIEGQCLDLALESRPPVGVATALRLARAKTGALLGGALEAGAVLGGAPATSAVALRRAGRELGAAFQVRDDWLGTWGDPELTGKSCSADLDRRKRTFAVAVAWEAASATGRGELRRLMSSPAPAATPRLRALLDDLDAGPRTAAAAERLAEAATARLDTAGLDARHRCELAELAGYVARRRR